MKFLGTIVMRVGDNWKQLSLCVSRCSVSRAGAFLHCVYILYVRHLSWFLGSTLLKKLVSWARECGYVCEYLEFGQRVWLCV